MKQLPYSKDNDPVRIRHLALIKETEQLLLELPKNPMKKILNQRLKNFKRQLKVYDEYMASNYQF